MQVLVFSEHEFLTGIVDSYCHVLGCCQIKPINKINDLLTTTIIKPKSVIFVDIELAEKFLTSPLWEETWQSLHENKVAICGVGNHKPNENEAIQWPIFNEFFTLPLSIDKVHDFLHDRMFPLELVKPERRTTERRGADRRNSDRRMGGRRIGERRRQIRINEEALSSTTSPIDHEHALNNQQNSDQILRVGSEVAPITWTTNQES